MAAAAGLPCTPHSANHGLVTLCAMHILRAIPNASPTARPLRLADALALRVQQVDLVEMLGSELLAPPSAELLHSPSCLGYVSYLVATAATASYPVAAAAVLPCYWVYADTGVRLAATARSAPGHPYARWVATYDDPGFQESTRRARALVDAAAEGTPSEVPAMHRAFAVATRFEHEFWRSAHEQETWRLTLD